MATPIDEFQVVFTTEELLTAIEAHALPNTLGERRVLMAAIILTEIINEPSIWEVVHEEATGRVVIGRWHRDQAGPPVGSGEAGRDPDWWRHL